MAARHSTAGDVRLTAWVASQSAIQPELSLASADPMASPALLTIRSTRPHVDTPEAGHDLAPEGVGAARLGEVGGEGLRPMADLRRQPLGRRALAVVVHGYPRPGVAEASGDGGADAAAGPGDQNGFSGV